MNNLTRHNIVVAGACNSWKSSLVNALTGHRSALVSDVAGTTTDPSRFLMEIPGAGPCRIIDTPGADDSDSKLGKERVTLAYKSLEEADLILLTVGFNRDVEARIVQTAEERHISLIRVATKTDLDRSDTAEAEIRTAITPSEKTGIDKLIALIAGRLSATTPPPPLLGGLVKSGDTVVLVMPQDSEAPKDRLILPQQLVIRALLDAGANALCTTPERYASIYDTLTATPDLVITDSQVFGQVNALTPQHVPLTSFSILMAHHKCDIAKCVSGAQALMALKGKEARILIAQACSHVPDGEDIGTVKLPRMLRKALGEQIHIDWAYGKTMPDTLGSYDIVIHCGACMFTRAHVMNRIGIISAAGIPVTNYGVAIAACQGILTRVAIPHL